MASIGTKIKEAAMKAAKEKVSGRQEGQEGQAHRRLGKRHGQGHEGRKEPSEIEEHTVGPGLYGVPVFPLLSPGFVRIMARVALRSLVHSSAWKGCSRNFGFTAFQEVRHGPGFGDRATNTPSSKRRSVCEIAFGLRASRVPSFRTPPRSPSYGMGVRDGETGGATTHRGPTRPHGRGSQVPSIERKGGPRTRSGADHTGQPLCRL